MFILVGIIKYILRKDSLSMLIIKRFFLFLLIFSSSCKYQHDNRVPIARAFDNYLYLDQLPAFENFNKEDSALFVYNFSNQWAREKLLFNKADFNIKETPIYIDSLLKIYKQSLLIHYYEQAIIQNYLDTVIHDSLIQSYYASNIANFKLKENIVKLNYIKIRSVAPNLDLAQSLYSSTEIEDVNKLKDYCLQFADRFFVGDTNWVSWSDFSKQFPIDYKSKKFNKNFFHTNKSIELVDSTYHYFIFIKDFKLKGTASPLEYVSWIVRKILINKRKKDILYNIEENLMNEAIENNNFEIYEENY